MAKQAMRVPQLDLNRQRTAPLPVPHTKRNHNIGVLTSMPAGRCVPVMCIPLLREDKLTGSVQIRTEMLETKELLLNPVYLRLTAYVVPLLALERFEGSRDQFDRSYKGQPKVDGGAVVPFIETDPMGAHGSNEVYKYLGLHAEPTDEVNTAYLEAYNQIWNFRAKNRSPLLTPRGRLTTTLAPAFWQSTRFEHVVPDFDQAVIDGEIPLNVVSGSLALSAAFAPVTGLYSNTSVSSGPFNNPVDDSAATLTTPREVSLDASTAVPRIRANLAGITAELEENGIVISLANIEVARRTQAFARMREMFQGLSDEYLIDLLMDGISLPDQQLKQPFLVADKTAKFGQAKRYATDAGNLAESAVSGGTMMSLALRVPRLNTGGVLMVIAEAMPEQLFERQRDPFFHSTSHEPWPEYLRDTLDPEKVDVVLNAEVDTNHSVPDSTFGYAPMNWKWGAMGPRVGGKFYRPTTDTTEDVERARIWALETVDPALGEDFYLVTNIHLKPFLDEETDPFELSAVGNCVIDGLTVFGGQLVEASGNYDEVLAKAPMDRIVKEGEELELVSPGGEGGELVNGNFESSEAPEA